MSCLSFLSVLSLCLLGSATHALHLRLFSVLFFIFIITTTSLFYFPRLLGNGKSPLPPPLSGLLAAPHPPCLFSFPPPPLHTPPSHLWQSRPHRHHHPPLSLAFPRCCPRKVPLTRPISLGSVFAVPTLVAPSGRRLFERSRRQCHSSISGVTFMSLLGALPRRAVRFLGSVFCGPSDLAQRPSPLLDPLPFPISTRPGRGFPYYPCLFRLIPAHGLTKP